jgi:hypothetical protein
MNQQSRHLKPSHARQRRVDRVLFFGGFVFLAFGAVVFVISNSRYSGLVIGIDDGIGVSLLLGVLFILSAISFTTKSGPRKLATVESDACGMSPRRVATIAAASHSVFVLGCVAVALVTKERMNAPPLAWILAICDRPIWNLVSDRMPALRHRDDLYLALPLLICGGGVYFIVAYLGTTLGKVRCRLVRTCSLARLLLGIACIGAMFGIGRLAATREGTAAFSFAWYCVLGSVAIALAIAIVSMTHARPAFHRTIGNANSVVIAAGGLGSVFGEGVCRMALNATPSGGALAAVVGGFLAAAFTATALGIAGVVVALLRDSRLPREGQLVARSDGSTHV